MTHMGDTYPYPQHVMLPPPLGGCRTGKVCLGCASQDFENVTCIAMALLSAICAIIRFHKVANELSKNDDN